MICPSCGNENYDNWPLKIDGKIVDGGCQECWEAHCSEMWWEVIQNTGIDIYRRKRNNETKTN